MKKSRQIANFNILAQISWKFPQQPTNFLHKTLEFSNPTANSTKARAPCNSHGIDYTG